MYSSQQDGSAQVVFRDYTPEDLPSCLTVFDSNVPAFFVEDERAEFTTFLHSLPGPYLVMISDAGQILGCGGYALVQAEARADLCWGMVHQELHGTGLGRRLTTARLERAIADPGVRTVALNTSQLTCGFYERLGFVTTEIIPDGYAPGLDRCEMRLYLNGDGREDVEWNLEG